MWDLRSDQQLATFKPPNSNPGYTSCGLSLSGRFIFCGSDDNSIHIWDTLKNQHNGKYSIDRIDIKIKFFKIRLTLPFVQRCFDGPRKPCNIT